MDTDKIVFLLKNSGLQNITVGNGVIEFDDPACLYPVFDNILEIGWIVILVLTAIMLFGWGVLYIKNGVKIENLFNNAKVIILIFCILSAVKPIVNVIYGDNLFARNCDRKTVSLSNVQELLNIRNQTLIDEDSLYEVFDMVDSGIVGQERIVINKSHEQNSNVDNVNISTQNIDNNYTDSTDKENNNIQFISITYSSNATIYINAKGEKTKRSGGSASWRNNNPGNIRKSKNSQSLGAIGTTDAWAVFPSEEAGLNAIIKLLRSKSYRNLSVSAAIHRWAPFGDGNNNPDSYSRKVSKMTGLSSDAKINSLNDSEMRRVANAIKIIEGWKPGKEEKL